MLFRIVRANNKREKLTTKVELTTLQELATVVDGERYKKNKVEVSFHKSELNLPFTYDGIISITEPTDKGGQ